MLVFTDAYGTVVRTVRTDPWLAERLCVSPDGGIWGTGNNVETPGYDPEGEVFAHFDSSGRLQGRFIPSRQIDPDSIRRPVRNDALGFPGIGCSADRVGAYFPAARTWMELSYSGELLGRWQVPLPARADAAGSAMVTATALSSSADVLAFLELNTDRGVYWLDRGASRWVRFATPGEGVLWSGLAGVADSRRVVLKGVQNGETAFYWLGLP